MSTKEKYLRLDPLHVCWFCGEITPDSARRNNACSERCFTLLVASKDTAWCDVVTDEEIKELESTPRGKE